MIQQSTNTSNQDFLSVGYIEGKAKYLVFNRKKEGKHFVASILLNSVLGAYNDIELYGTEYIVLLIKPQLIKAFNNFDNIKTYFYSTEEKLAKLYIPANSSTGRTLSLMLLE